MRILYITNRVPFPPHGGYPIVVYNSIKGALNEGAEVTLFSLNTNKHHVSVRTVKDPLLDSISFVTCSINIDVNAWEEVKSVMSKRSPHVFRYYKAAAISQLKNILRKNKFDIIQFEGLFVVPYLPLIRQLSQAMVVYRAHNIEYRIWEQQAFAETFPIRKFYLTYLSSQLRQFEFDNMNKFDAVVTLNEADLRELKYQGCSVRMDNFSVMLDPDDYRPDAAPTEALSIFHLGSMEWLPNQEGLQWFLEHVWDDLQKLNVGLTFHIAGTNIPQEIEELADHEIKVYPHLDDAKSFMNSKSIMVVPLQSGSGMRVKIIEGMAMKKCIISTSLGAEGIRYEHGKNILIADTADDFYRYILQCTTDSGLVERIGEYARLLFEKDHHIEPVAKRMMNFYQKLTLQ
ncbi:glycosyltransferase family 4 protein [Flavihumibacter sp. R14]|nr:glycosyltransferase family 4 protein [Flavihumibacter soli]